MASDVASAIIKGSLLFLYILGSTIIIVLVLQMISKVYLGRNRWKSLDGADKRTNQFSLRNIPALNRFAEIINFSETKLKMEYVLVLMLAMAVISFSLFESALFLLQQRLAAEIALTNVWPVSLIFNLLTGSLPFFYISFLVQRKRHRIALKMIMLVQNLIGNYQTRITIAEVINRSAATMPEDVQSEWSRLALSLHIKPLDQALYEFAKRIDNRWADDLVDILLIGASIGVDITESLQKLVQKMQRAKSNEEKRLAMITVFRLGTVVMVFFIFFFVGLNIWLDNANFNAYFGTAAGRLMLLVSALVMFASMILVIRTGKKVF